MPDEGKDHNQATNPRQQERTNSDIATIRQYANAKATQRKGDENNTDNESNDTVPKSLNLPIKMRGQPRTLCVMALRIVHHNRYNPQ